MTRIARAFRRAALPLASYYAVTLALPVANGAARGDSFLAHALVVLVVPPLAVLLACAAGLAWSIVANRRRRSVSAPGSVIGRCSAVDYPRMTR